MWFQLKIEQCSGEEAEPISDELMELEALSITFTDKNDNPIFEPAPGTTPLWPEVTIQALYDQELTAQLAKAQLATSRPSLQCSIEMIPDQDWERAWMKDFKPQRFGKRLWICPTWSTPPEPDAVNLILDPGLAFGTGTHPTTSLCLTWLEQANLYHKSIIDYGCGSGILSLAALKLGAQTAYAVDIDKQALQATQNNATANDINEKQLLISQPEALQTAADVIIANILLAPLISLKERFHQLLRAKSFLVVSGLLAEQVPLLIEAYRTTFDLIDTQYLDEWALLVFSRS